MKYDATVLNWDNLKQRISGETGFRGEIRTDEPMACHTTFKIGGPASLYLKPADFEETTAVLDYLREQEVPVFVLGGGANILVSDKGIRGAVLDTGSLDSVSVSVSGTSVRTGAGKDISSLALETAEKGLSGLHAFYGMPGSIGGAVFMNARCYDEEISYLFKEAVVYTGGEIKTVPFDKGEWGYKKSPFQTGGGIILETLFQLVPGDPVKLKSHAEEIYKDRQEKGHFRAPCAGSVFKNNRAFGEPSGKIIDRLGFRGFQIGRAAVSDWHANIFINKGGASASEIRDLILHVQNRVKEETGFFLEPEVLFVGDWE